MTTPLRIEMMLPSIPRAGMEVVAARLARLLRDRGHDVGFTCIEGPGDLGLDLRADAFRVSVVPAPGLRPNLVARELGPWLAHVKPDVVHVHNGVWLKAIQGARHAGVPRTVFTLHGVEAAEPWYVRSLNGYAARHTTQIVAVSESLRHYLHESLHVQLDRISVVENGVSTERFHPGVRSAAARAAVGLPCDERTIIGIVARLFPVKRHDVLLDAFARVLQERADVHLAVVGDGPCRSELERQIEQLGLREHVSMLGAQRDTAPLLRQLDVYTLSSDGEGTSMSILEAMATELPVVATAVGGTPALLRDGACGRLVPPADSAALARALLEVTSNRDLARRLATHARRTVETWHSEERVADMYEQIYGFSRAVPPHFLQVPVH
jgi:glycosyltransferase involved in cell wall biosynthesis